MAGCVQASLSTSATFFHVFSGVRTKIGLRKVEAKLSVSFTKKFLKNIALSNSTLWKLFKMWSLNLSKVELERAIFFKNFLVVESGKIVSTSLNPTFCPDSRAVVYKSEKTLHS